MCLHCKLVILMLVLIPDGQGKLRAFLILFDPHNGTNIINCFSSVHAGKVIGGQEAKPHSRPYMVLLERHMQNGSTIHCGGFLLSDDFVMTAAHCHAKSFTVILGLHSIHDKNENVQTINVEQAFPHKDYNGTTYINDVMLLKLSSKPNITNNVRPIPLAGWGDGSLPKSCTIAGWGATTHEKNGYMSPQLMEVSVTLIKHDQCARANEYCSQGESGGGKGDSGGPLVCEDEKAYGVVSSNYLPDSGTPRINRYPKIPDHKSWIDSITKI
ncbi:granzyme B(G,H)-like isoform X1 [Embiotoca jacksoni]|uniref:granzyme B(G,H)-like isoform X1 n=1 Tax=Embiotoca jacksoni TaxID=100190 RepID=UPI003703CB1F